jgi:hypothetical protein
MKESDVDSIYAILKHTCFVENLQMRAMFKNLSLGLGV